MVQRYDIRIVFVVSIHISYIQQKPQFSLNQVVSNYQRHTQTIKMEASEKIRIARIDYISWVSQMIGREDIDVRRREQEVLLKQARVSIEAKNVESFFRARDFDNVVVLNYASPTDMHIMKVSFFYAISAIEIVMLCSNSAQKPIRFLRFLLIRSKNMKKQPNSESI